MQGDRAVVGAEDVVVDGGACELWGEGFGDDPVVNAPAHVLSAGPAAIAPPGIGFGGFGVEMAEGVDETGVEEFVEACPFLRGEARAFVIGFRAGEIDFLVGDIEVTAGYDRFPFGLERFKVLAEGHVPFHAVGEAEEFVFGVGRVNGDEEESGVFEGDDAALEVSFGAFRAPDSQSYAEGFGFREDGGAGVAGFYGRVPVGSVTREFEGEVDLFWFRLGFLEAEDVRGVFEDELGEVLF